jgi:competence ComEA-like helix-hairpin-helix protein
MKKTILLALVFLLPSAAHAALININTADATTLDTLPGIGPSKATAIVDYRTQNGSFSIIDDIMNVSGIGPSTFANIKDLITVGESIHENNLPPQATTTPETRATTTPFVPTQTGGGTPEYIPLPNLRIIMSAPHSVTVGAESPYSVRVFDNQGRLREDALVHWSFGDGVERTGTSVRHAYLEAGTYEVVVEIATSDGGTESTDFEVAAEQLAVSVVSVDERGISVMNR